MINKGQGGQNPGHGRETKGGLDVFALCRVGHVSPMYLEELGVMPDRLTGERATELAAENN